jgi:hypothetical protein
MNCTRWVQEVRACGADEGKREQSDALPCIRLLTSGAFLKKLTEVSCSWAHRASLPYTAYRVALSSLAVFHRMQGVLLRSFEQVDTFCMIARKRLSELTDQESDRPQNTYSIAPQLLSKVWSPVQMEDSVNA